MRLAATHARKLLRLRTGAASDSGAVATIVTLLLAGGVLMGMAALTIDVGQIYAERAELQNGADAAALAVAQDCAITSDCDTSLTGLSKDMADENARRDGKAGITAVCGDSEAGGPALLPCETHSGPLLTQCIEAMPDGATGWVEVRTATEEIGGSDKTLLPSTFARALAGGGNEGTSVAACARAAWGPPGGMATLPITISKCEFEYFTGVTSGTAGLQQPPPYNSANPRPSSYEVALVLKDPAAENAPSNCPASPPGGDAPGGFGWLKVASSTECTVVVTGETVGANPGVPPPNGCADEIVNAHETVIWIPIYDSVTGTGSGAVYGIAGYAGFFVSGFYLKPGSSDPLNEPADRLTGCVSVGSTGGGSTRCLYGWFVTGLTPQGGSIGGGTDYGARVVQLVG